jgi:antitoxin VapB
VIQVAISIRNPKAEALARETAREAGETLADAIIHSLEERLAKLRGRRTQQNLTEQLLEIAHRCGSLPDLDPRSAEEILGYDQNGSMA